MRRFKTFVILLFGIGVTLFATYKAATFIGISPLLFTQSPQTSTYKNAKYSFQFSYPTNIFIMSEQSNNENIILLHKKYADTLKLEEQPFVVIDIAAGNLEEELRNLKDQQKADQPSFLDFTNETEVAGLKAYKSEIEDGQKIVLGVIFQKDQHIFSIQLGNLSEQVSKEDLNAMKQSYYELIDSFKFND